MAQPLSTIPSDVSAYLAALKAEIAAAQLDIYRPGARRDQQAAARQTIAYAQAEIKATLRAQQIARPATYTVRPYDTLRLIAQTMLGDVRQTAALKQANGLVGDRLSAGLVLVLPPALPTPQQQSGPYDLASLLSTSESTAPSDYPYQSLTSGNGAGLTSPLASNG